jgi:integrase/recombinase XerD
MRLTEAFDRYCLDCIVFRNQSKKTEENHYVCLRALVAYLGDAEIEEVTFHQIRDWKMHLDKTRSSSTVRNYVIRLRVVLAHLEKLGLKVVSPDLVPVPKRVDRVPSVICKEQVTSLIASTKNIKYKAIVSLLYASGLRVSELCALNREDVKGDSFTVVGKGGKARLCFLDERTKVLTALYLEQRTDNHAALFMTDYSSRMTPGTVQETFRRLRRVSGIECHPHTLRHSYATNLMDNGMHIYTLSRLMGHSSIQTTSVYLHVTDPQLKSEYDKHHRT